MTAVHPIRPGDGLEPDHGRLPDPADPDIQSTDDPGVEAVRAGGRPGLTGLDVLPDPLPLLDFRPDLDAPGEAEPEELPGRLVFDISRSAWSPHLARHDVRVTVDGLPLRVPWGRTTVALPAGRHRVQVQVDSRRGWGLVTDAVPVASGAEVEVFYRAPALPQVLGALGPQPQLTRGLSVLLGGGAVVLAVALAVAVAALALLS